jgi:uncharacterized membrane protein
VASYTSFFTAAASVAGALTGLLFVALAGLTPRGGTQLASVIVGLVGLSSSAGLAWRLWQSRHDESLSKRWPYLLLLIVTMYLAQIVLALTAQSAADSDSDSVTFILIMFAVGIARSWELLGLEGGGVLDLLVQRLNRSGPGEPPG